MCDAYKMGMTQREGYVWFLPGWFGDDWYDIEKLKKGKAEERYLPIKTCIQTEKRDSHIFGKFPSNQAKDLIKVKSKRRRM